jgi:hypothetical protein
MNWALAGWILIGLCALLLGIFTLVFKAKSGYQVRKAPGLDRFVDAQIAAIEGGLHQQVSLGLQFAPGLYPGLGLQGLLLFPNLLPAEAGAAQGVSVSAGDGSLAVLAQQIIRNQYLGGYWQLLPQGGVSATLPGPTQPSYAAGLMSELGFRRHGSLAILGYHGAETVLYAEALTQKGGTFFSTSGSLLSQAALFPVVNDLMIGENIYRLGGLLKPSPGNQVGWLVEDVIRISMMILLIVAVVLKMVGVL